MELRQIDGYKMKVGSEGVILRCGEYNNKRLAIRLFSFDGLPFGTITINVPEYDLGSREILIKDWAENSELIEPLLATGLFEVTDKTVKTGYVEAKVWKLVEGVISINKGPISKTTNFLMYNSI